MAKIKLQQDGQWVILADDNNTVKHTPQDLTSAQASQARNNIGVFTQPTQPTSANEGDIWFDTSRGVADYIVEQGTISSEGYAWTYRKWNSGVCEAWAYVEKAWGGTTTINNFNFGYASISLPKIFTDITTVNYSCYASSGYDFGGKVVIQGTTSFNVYIGSTGTLDPAVRLRPHVIGTWK